MKSLRRDRQKTRKRARSRQAATGRRSWFSVSTISVSKKLVRMRVSRIMAGLKLMIHIQTFCKTLKSCHPIWMSFISALKRNSFLNL